MPTHYVFIYVEPLLTIAILIVASAIILAVANWWIERPEGEARPHHKWVCRAFLQRFRLARQALGLIWPREAGGKSSKVL